ncbi:hypothetical protein DB30_08081 [Enhygromyxa salina]|uniref:Uncharacterized protein n=1 Tax=Enhygromyxa salina TaxID=215803 RepID=A0A0C2CUZ1_9BACT|nr:hypothetical protein DB30_08081 [Enhygromyxa salina]
MAAPFARRLRGPLAKLPSQTGYPRFAISLIQLMMLARW